MNRRAKFFSGSLLIVAAVGGLIYTAVRETSAYFLTMEEYSASSAEMAGRALRIAGRVSDGTVDWDPTTLDLEFVMGAIPPKEAHRDSKDGVMPGTSLVSEVSAAESAGDPTKTIKVQYNGVLPDMFADGRDVIVEGRVENGVFQADTLLTTCPSKYESEVQPDGETADAPAQSY